MKKKKVLSMLMTAVLTFTSVIPQPALLVSAGDEVIIEEVSEEDTDEESLSENQTESISDNETETVSGNENISENEAASGNDDKVLPEGIKGMPEDYAVSDRESDIKADMVSHNVLTELKSAVAGVDYIEDQVYCIADSEEYAQEIADAYGIELTDYNYQVAIFSTKESGRDVYETVELGLDEAYQLPPLSPDYILRTAITESENESGNEIFTISSGQPVNTQADWEDIRDLLGDGLDPLLTPNDPNYQWWHDMMDTYAAWGLYGTDYSGSGIKVAVIDGRIYDTHEDLNDNVAVIEEAGGGSLAADGHGTQVAGIIGAKAGNSKGGAGIAPGVQMYSLSASDESGAITGAHVTACLKYLENSGVNIACMSFCSNVYDANQKEAVQKVNEKGITLLAPAGDMNENNAIYPAQYDHVISVGAVKQDGSKVCSSGKGNGQADVYAPGAEMMSTCSDGSYRAEMGASMACAAAAGACALYMSIAGAVGPDEMEAVLTGKTIKGKALESGAGIVNIAKMLGTGATGPKLELYDHTGLVKTVGSGASAGATVYSLSSIFVTPMLESGEENTDKNVQVFFTIDGKRPSFKNGVACEGTYSVTLSERKGKAVYEIEIDRFVNMDREQKCKLNVKVVCVTESGECSEVTTLKLNVKPMWYNYELYITDIPEGYYEVSSGSSLKLKAQLLKETRERIKTAKPKNLRWEITEGSDIASIGKKNGLLKTNMGKTGKVTIRCSCKEKGITVISDERTIFVGNHAPVKNFTISDSSLELDTGMGIKRVSITSAINSNGEDILSEDYVEYRWESSDWDVAHLSSTSGKEVSIYPSGKGRAFVTCTALDGSKKSKKIKIIVRQKVVSIEIDGQDSIAAGSSASYKAKAYGKRDIATDKEIASPNNKGVTWYLNDVGCTELSGGEVRIDPDKGIVKIADDPSVKEFYVCALADDGSEKSGRKYVRITNKKTASLSVTTDASDDAYQIRLDKKGNIASMQLYTTDSVSSTVNETKMLISVASDSHTKVNWKSSNEDVVNVIDILGGEAELRAIGSGSATITCTAGDGSGKKVSFKVKVIVPVSHLMMTNDDLNVYTGGPDGNSYVCLEKGKATAMQVVAGDSYGKPDNPKVKWNYEIVGYDENNNKTVLDKEIAEKAEKAKLFTVKGAKVKIDKNFDTLCEQNALPGRIGILITVASTDGSNVSDSILIVPAEPGSNK